MQVKSVLYSFLDKKHLALTKLMVDFCKIAAV